MFEVSTDTKQTMQIYDVTGKMVMSKFINNKAYIDASSLADGIYTISIKGIEGMTNKKLIIIK